MATACERAIAVVDERLIATKSEVVFLFGWFEGLTNRPIEPREPRKETLGRCVAGVLVKNEADDDAAVSADVMVIENGCVFASGADPAAADLDTVRWPAHECSRIGHWGSCWNDRSSTHSQETAGVRRSPTCELWPRQSGQIAHRP